MKYRKVYDKGELVAWECENGRIEIYDYDVTVGGSFHRDYYANGWRFSTLKEAKKEIEKLELKKKGN